MSGQQIPLAPMIRVAGAWFAPHAIIGVDPFEYTPSVKGRVITLLLAGGEIDFVDDAADAFHAWWGQLTGTARIQAPPPGPLHLAPGLKNK